MTVSTGGRRRGDGRPRGRRRIVVAGLGLGLALLATTPAAWVRATTWTPLAERAEIAVTGAHAAPAVGAAGLLVVAAALAMATARRWGSALAAAVLVGGAAVAVGAAVSVLVDPTAAAVAAARASVGVGVLDGAATATAASWAAAVLGTVGGLVGVRAGVTSRRWVAPSARYQSVAMPVRGTPEGHDTPERTVDSSDAGWSEGIEGSAAWDALSRGEDPTA